MKDGRLRQKDKHRKRRGSIAPDGSHHKAVTAESIRKSTYITTHEFANPKFSPENYMQSKKLENEEQVRVLCDDLEKMEQTNRLDMQHKLKDNYTELVTISKEISNLDSDVLRLKELLNDLRVIWEGLRSETMDDSAVSTQLPRELENIEGVETFLDADCRVIHESANIIELDPKTHKGRRHIQMFVLDDSILIVVRKRSESNHIRLVAQQNLSLRDIDVRDFKDVPNGFKIVKYPNTFLYRSERPEEKSLLLDICQRMQRNHSGEIPKSQDGSAAKQLSDLADLADDLEVLVALRKFDEAVQKIEKAQTEFKPEDLTKNAQLQQHIETLCATIVEDLENILLTKLQFQRNVDWLIRLGRAEQARDVFLLTRSRIIKKRTRQLVFEGDIARYIDELALVVFTLIRNTCEWYRDSFKNNDMASGFVTWVREQANIYAEIYKRQVFSQSQPSCELVARCSRLTAERSSMLCKVGLDVRFLMADLFLENVKETVIAYKQTILAKVDRYIQNDTFEFVKSEKLGSDVKVTHSVIRFYNLLTKFVGDACLVSELQLYMTVIDCVKELTEHYLEEMTRAAAEHEEERVRNKTFVLNSIVPRVSSELKYHFDRPIPELDHLRSDMI